MQGTPTGPAGTSAEGPRRTRWAAIVGLLVILVGIGVASTVLVPLAQGKGVTWSSFVATYDWIVAVVIVLLVIVLLVYGLRRAFPEPRERVRYRRLRRRYYPDQPEAVPGPDQAVSIARQRYARGEISSDQLDQILRQLGKGPGTVAPP